MDWNTPDLNAWPSKLVISVGKKLRSNRSYSEANIRKDEAKNAERLRKAAEKHGARYGWHRHSVDSASQQHDVNELGERKFSEFSQASTLLNNKDHTEMIHTLTHQDSFDSLLDKVVAKQVEDPLLELDDAEAVALARKELSDKNLRLLASLPEDVWQRVASFLSPADTAILAISLKMLSQKLGFGPLRDMNQLQNRDQRISFLHRIDKHYPRHLLCFPCAKYHFRTQPGKESLKADYVANPLFACPNTRNTYLPRMRLVHGRYLPYSFVQLPLRADRHASPYGITADALSRRWKCKDSEWNHRTRYTVQDGHLLMRVVSQAFALPSAEMTETRERHLLYDREEYTPFFSVCAHWKDGELMRICKCALSHVPSPPVSYFQQLKKGPKLSHAMAHSNFIVRGCDKCQPARRCPECPTEYLVEVQMLEDKNDTIRPFKHAIVVTRWSDLGDGSSPYTSPEWTAIIGSGEATGKPLYESFSHVGRRAVGGIFESKISGSVPGQRLISLNPKNEKLGEDGTGWY
jgi:hypothetical protein